MGLKAAVQALKKAEPLKDKVQRSKDLLNDDDAWTSQRQLQKIYQQVLILDLEYALDRKVEQELWNLGFKNYIALLQSQAKDRRNPKRGESQAMLTWCLEAASGFYLTLLQEICTAFDLDLPFRRKSYVYGCISPWKAVEKLSAPQKSSCFYACQYCLVHLGDIARYRNQNKQAELFYRHAVSLSPSSGQPYNQLALLEASRGDKLGTVFHYVRSVSLKHPFPVATANLAKTLSTALNDNSFNIEGKTKLTSQEYITVFLKFHGILYNLGNLSVATTYVKLLNDTLTALVATESFNSWKLVQMLIINLYALQHSAGVSNDNTDLIKSDQLSSDEKISRNCILDLIAGSLSALLLPVYTIKNSLVNYFALPTIKLCLDWIQMKPTILEEVAFTSRLQIWPSLCVLLNGLQSCVTEFEYNLYVKTPLPEDRDLQGFLPLEKSFESLRFSNTELEGDNIMLNKLRAMRIIQLGRSLAQIQVNGATLISLSAEEENDQEKFTPASEGTGLSIELMKELEELSLNKDKQPISANSPVPSETASSKGSSEIDSLIAELGLEKRGGILKPQGSLERNRDSGELANSTENNSQPLLARKPRQNVAMQAIMRRAESEQKQVTFKNISPVIDETTRNKLTVDPVTHSTSIISQPVKINNSKNVSVSSSVLTNGTVSVNAISAPIIQPRPPLMPNAPLNVHKSTPVIQQQQQKQQQQQQQQKQQQQPQQQQSEQIKLEKRMNNVVIQQPQQRENIVLPTASMGQFPMAELQAAPLHLPSGPNLSQYSQPQQQQQTPLPQNAALYQNQGFNVQTPQFNKNFMTNPSASLQQYNVPSAISGQYGNSQPSSNQTIPYSTNVNVNQGRLMQQTQPQAQQRGSFPPMTQGNPLMALNPGMNMTSAQAQPQQSIGQSIGHPIQQNSLGMHPQNLLLNSQRPPVNGLNMQNHMGIPPASAPPNLSATYQSSLPETAITNAAVSNMQQHLNFVGANFSQSNFGQLQPQQQKQISSPYGNGQQQQFSFSNQTNMGKTQQQMSMNNYPVFQGYETKDYNPWKDQQAPQPPVNWWGNNSMASQILPQQGTVKDISMNTDAFQNWANSSNSAGQRLSNMPVQPGNNYQQNPHQTRLFNGRNNFEESRSFDVDQKQQQPVTSGNTYSLFSGNSWGVNGHLAGSSNMSSSNQQDQMKARLNQQSLWSGPGPSPLERLLEQQKSLREGGT